MQQAITNLRKDVEAVFADTSVSPDITRGRLKEAKQDLEDIISEIEACLDAIDTDDIDS